MSVALQTRPDALVTGLDRAEDDDQRRLCGLVKRCRARISPERPSLGPFPRLPMRIGKTVTQEEVAEAVGISRQWYALLESDRSGRVSAAVLARTADALMMDAAERAALFRLAVPELRSTSLTHHATIVLEAFRSLHRLTQRLWAATTEAEALTLVREHAMTTLDPDAMVTCTSLGQGRWDDAATGEDDDCGKRFHTSIRQRWGNAATEDLHCYSPMAEPGELMTRSELARRPNVSFVTANVRSHRGFFARLSVVHFAAHEYSEIERAQLSGLAELTSLALS